VAAVTVPPGGSPLTGKSLVGKLAKRLHARAQSRQGQPSRVGSFLADHTWTITALGFADTACWHWGSTAGLIGSAVCVLVAEFKVRG
jgi:hypothetical protein